MANYYSTSRTNYFHVTDEDAYQKLFSKLSGYEDSVHDFSKVEDDGRVLHGFGSYSGVSYYEDEDSDPDFDIFLEKLQEILPEDEAFIYVESGSEKLRYIEGLAVCVTRHDILSENLNHWASDAARAMLGNPKYEADLCY